MTNLFVLPVANSEIKVFELSVTRVRDFDAEGNIVKEKYTILNGEEMLGENLNWFEIDDIFLEAVTRGHEDACA